MAGSAVVVEGFDPRKLKPRILKDISNEVLYDLAEQILEDTEEFIPMNKGILRNNATYKRSGDNQIEFIDSRRIYFKNADGTRSWVEGAKYLYEGINPIRQTPIQEWTTAGTGDHWFEMSYEQNWEKWKRQYTRKYVQELNNI